MKIGNSTAVSSNATVNISVPQGSILGCMLFSAYINDLPLVSKILKPILFTDDTVLMHSNFEMLVHQFNLELSEVNLWLDRNRLTLNVDKTVAIIFSKRKNEVNITNRLRFSNSHLNYDKRVKYLGITLDENLSFRDHITKMTVKVVRSVGMMYRISFYVPNSVMLNMYKTLIYPLLTYCNIVWGGSAVTNLNKLLILQKKIVRIITNRNYLEHSEPLFRQTAILKIHDLYDYLCLLTAFKMKDTFSLTSHSHETKK